MPQPVSRVVRLTTEDVIDDGDALMVRLGDPPSPLSGPAPVVARALGYHDKTTARLVTETGGTWSRYAPGEHSR